MARLFHGSRKDFTAFDPYQIGMGAEPNSALGVWLSVDASMASDYEGGRFLMVVETGPLKLAHVADTEMAIWGPGRRGGRPGPAQWELFAEARKTLTSEGYDGVWCEMPGFELSGCLCVFDPSILTITEVIPYPEDRDLAGTIHEAVVSHRIGMTSPILV